MTRAVIPESDAASVQWQRELCADLESHDFWRPSPGDGRIPSSATDWQVVLAEVIRLHQFGRGRPQRPESVDAARLGSRIRRGQIPVNTTAPGETELVEAALSRLAYGQTTLINGNLAATNIRIDDNRVGFVGWDDARVDAPEFGLAPLGVLRGQRARVADAAVSARAVATGPKAGSDRSLQDLTETPTPGWPDPNLREGNIILRGRSPADVAAQLEGEDAEMARWLTGGVSTDDGVRHHVEATARL